MQLNSFSLKMLKKEHSIKEQIEFLGSIKIRALNGNEYVRLKMRVRQVEVYFQINKRKLDKMTMKQVAELIKEEKKKFIELINRPQKWKYASYLKSNCVGLFADQYSEMSNNKFENTNYRLLKMIEKYNVEKENFKDFYNNFSKINIKALSA